MVSEIINEYRRQNNREPVRYWNRILDDYCLAHSVAMFNNRDLYHAPDCYLKDYAEIIGCYDFIDTVLNTFRFMLSDTDKKYPEHKKILLESQEMGYGYITHDGKFYITIRGK